MKKIFIMQQCYMVIYIDPANDAHEVQNGPTTEEIISHILTMGKPCKIISETMSPRAFIFCV